MHLHLQALTALAEDRAVARLKLLHVGEDGLATHDVVGADRPGKAAAELLRLAVNVLALRHRSLPVKPRYLRLLANADVVRPAGVVEGLQARQRGRGRVLDGFVSAALHWGCARARWLKHTVKGCKFARYRREGYKRDNLISYLLSLIGRLHNGTNQSLLPSAYVARRALGKQRTGVFQR